MKCPHCGVDLDLYERNLRNVNIACGYGMSAGASMHGFIVFFTGYKESATSIELIGQCVAWKPLSFEKGEIGYYCIPRRPGERVLVHEFKRGDTLEGLGHGISFTGDHQSAQQLIMAKSRAMDVLIRHIASISVKESSSGDQDRKDGGDPATTGGSDPRAGLEENSK